MAFSILHWLNGSGDYNTGVELFRQYAGNSILLNLFQQGENSFTREELRNELQAIYKAQNVTPPAPHLPLPQLHPEHHNPDDFEQHSQTVWFKIDVTKLPPELRKLWNKKGAITEEQKALFYRLPLMRKKEDRRLACLRILSIEAERNQLWQTFNQWHENGTLPEKPAPLTPEQLKKAVKNLTTRISKLKGRHRDAQRQKLIEERETLKKQLT